MKKKNQLDIVKMKAISHKLILLKYKIIQINPPCPLKRQRD